MIARLSSAVFYIITRKLLGAFYVDQKKKDLPPSTLPSEHKQWVTNNKTLSNDEGAYVMLPLTFPTKCVTALLSDTYGRLSNSSAMANQTEGAKVNAVTINSVQIINYWSGGLDTDVTVLAIGY